MGQEINYQACWSKEFYPTSSTGASMRLATLAGGKGEKSKTGETGKKDRGQRTENRRQLRTKD
jgi:hypothetical protein